MKKKHIILVAVAAFLLIVYGINVHNMRTRPRPAPTPETVTVTPKPAQEKDLNAVYHVAELLKQQMPDDEIHMEYDPESQTVFYRISAADLTADVIELTKVTPSMTEEWDNMVDSMIYMQKQMSDYFERAGIYDMTVVVQVLNPDNDDEVWLVVANGIAGYDVVSGIDLRGGQD